jgi:hypothetical protein
MSRTSGRGCGSFREPLASRRSTAGLTKALTPWLSFGPRFVESPGANGRTLPDASAASTSHSGRSAGGMILPGGASKDDAGERYFCAVAPPRWK